jgi:methylated-DNA-[protein]-cysteine S-methyltransferase
VLFPSPLGGLGIELVDGLVTRVVIAPVGKDRSAYPTLAELKRSPATDVLDEVVGRFSEYFAGARRKLDLDYDLRSCELDGFGRRVLKQTAKIPFGRTRTYQEIAAAVGRPEAYRQVVAVLLANPLPIVIPCHRVVPSKAGIGSYVGGEKKKAWLLKLESRPTLLP